MTLTAELGITRRSDPARYSREWRKRNREVNNAYHRRYYHEVVKKNPEKLAAKNKSISYARRKSKYGISKEEYEALVLKQGSKCLICQEHCDNLRVDHDHETGEVCGLLCPNCNAGLGMFGEDPERLRAAIRYLSQFEMRTSPYGMDV